MKKLIIISKLTCLISVSTLTVSAQGLRDRLPVSESRADVHVYRFIDGIEITGSKPPAPESRKTGTVSHSATKYLTVENSGVPGSIETANSLQFKFAQLLDCNVESIRNIPLYEFIDEWWGARYRYGGSSKKGIDCSSFTGLLMGVVFAKKLPRTSREQYNACDHISKEEMQEGDLVFFNTRGGVSHVGVYLADGFFVHASRNNGVTISRLDEPYYDRRFIRAGRFSGDKRNEE